MKQRKEKEVQKEAESEEDLTSYFESNCGYFHVRRLPDGNYAGLVRLIFTVGLCVGLDRIGYKYRFCFKTLEEALAGLRDLETIDTVPEGWIARR